MNSRRIIVIGAGVAGLVAARRLSQAGHAVRVLEAAEFRAGASARGGYEASVSTRGRASSTISAGRSTHCSTKSVSRRRWFPCAISRRNASAPMEAGPWS